MSKREKRRQQATQDFTSLSDLTVESYGLDNLDIPERITAKPINIDQIIPDPEQPRRAIPAGLRRELGEGDAGTIMRRWCERYADLLDVAEMLESPDRDDLLDDTDDIERLPENADPGLVALLHIVDLAASIRRDKLANPITVVRREGGYVIETGERRWLAYHLLNQFYPEADFGAIPARVVDDFNVWRQAAENGARDDLNTIGKARQFALLLMDLLRRKKQQDFRPLHDFDTEQDYYAQVAELSPPYGDAPKILGAMGVTHRNAISRYRKILRLPNPVWGWADDYDWTENRLRALDGLDDAEAVEKARRWVEGDDDGEMSPTGDISLSPVVRTLERGLSALDKLDAKKVTSLRAAERRELRERLATYRRKLEEIENWLG